MYTLHKLIFYLAIVLAVFGIFYLSYWINKIKRRKRKLNNLPTYNESCTEFLCAEFLMISAIIGFIIFAFSTMVLYVSCFDEDGRVLTEKSVDTCNIYSLSDTSELNISGHYNKAFVLAEGDITSSNQISYKYYSEDKVNGKNVKKINVISTEDNNIYFNDTLKDGDQATLEVITTEITKDFVWSEKALNSKFRCWLFKHKNTFFPLTHPLTETKVEYIFNIPEDSVVYEYKLDTM